MIYKLKLNDQGTRVVHSREGREGLWGAHPKHKEFHGIFRKHIFKNTGDSISQLHNLSLVIVSHIPLPPDEQSYIYTHKEVSMEFLENIFSKTLEMVIHSFTICHCLPHPSPRRTKLQKQPSFQNKEVSMEFVENIFSKTLEMVFHSFTICHCLPHPSPRRTKLHMHPRSPSRKVSTEFLENIFSKTLEIVFHSFTICHWLPHPLPQKYKAMYS